MGSRIRRTQLPDHGELWSQDADDRRAYVARRARARRRRGSVVACRTASRARSASRRRVTWSSSTRPRTRERIGFRSSGPRSPLLPLTSGTRIELARRRHACTCTLSTRSRSASARRTSDGRWCDRQGRLLDLSHPFGVAKRYACKVFLEMREGRAAVIEDGLRLEVDVRRRRDPECRTVDQSRRVDAAQARQAVSEPLVPALHRRARIRSRRRSARGRARTGSTPGKSRRWSMRWRAVPATAASRGRRQKLNCA